VPRRPFCPLSRCWAIWVKRQPEKWRLRLRVVASNATIAAMLVSEVVGKRAGAHIHTDNNPISSFIAFLAYISRTV